MNFDAFIPCILKLKTLPLPGEASHHKMAPALRLKALKSADVVKKNPKKAAVVALFYPDSVHNTRLLLLLRKTYAGIHSNQVGFPGGKLETKDKDFQSAALRETYEEVGIAPHNIEIIKPLSEIYIPPSNFRVWPFVGMTEHLPFFKPQDDEVEALIEVLLSDFLDDNAIGYEKVNTTYMGNMMTPVFKLNGYLVWGATAMILNEIKALFRQCHII